MNGKYELFGHTIEVRGSGTGSLDPWSGDYAREHNISVMCTSDMANFILVDGDEVYRIKHGQISFCNSIENGGFSSWEEVQQVIDIYTDRKFGSLKESINSLDELQKRNEMFKKMSKEEKEAYFAECRKKIREQNNMA